METQPALFINAHEFQTNAIYRRVGKTYFLRQNLLFHEVANNFWKFQVNNFVIALELSASLRGQCVLGIYF